MKYEDILLMGLTGLMHTPASTIILRDSRPSQEEYYCSCIFALFEIYIGVL